MSKKTTIVIGISAAVALILSILAITNPVTNVVERVVEREVGAIPGNEISSPSIVVNGVETFQYTQTWKTGTSTLCVFKAPAATSTLVSFKAKNKTATSTTLLMMLLRDSTDGYPEAIGDTTTTTGRISEMLLDAGSDAPFLWYASSTASAGTYKTIVEDITEFKPGTYLIYYAAAGGAGSISSKGTENNDMPDGICSAIFQRVP